MSDSPVDELIRRARRGDGEALGQLMGRFRNYVKVLARMQLAHYLSGKVDPSDLVQDTFLESCRQFDAFRGRTEPEFLAWQRQILNRQLVNRLRHYCGARKRNVRLERSLEDALGQSSLLLRNLLIDGGSSPSEAAQRRERSVMLADALEALPAHYRDVLVYRHLEELPFKEVARRMKRSLNSVEKLWMRALPALRARLQDAT